MQFALLLEDEPLQVKLITDLLKYQLGLAVKATDSLDEALLLADESPALIISDISLEKPSGPDSKINKDGIIFSQRVKSNNKTKHIPLILRSSMPLAYFGADLADVKADIFLDKNTSNTGLLNTIKNFGIANLA